MSVIQIIAPNPTGTPEQVIPAVTYDKLWLSSFSATFPDVNGDGSVSVQMQQYGTDASGVNHVLTPGLYQIIYTTDNVIAQSYSNPAIASGLNAVLAAVASLINLSTVSP